MDFHGKDINNILKLQTCVGCFQKNMPIYQ